MKGAGCEKCNHTGYKGRVGLYEVMEISEELRELILVGASGLELRRKAIDEGMITLRRAGSEGQRRRHDDRRGREGDGEIDGIMADTARAVERRWSTMEGSDLHITTNTPPQMRVHGQLQRLPTAGPDAGRDQAARLQRAHRRAEEALRGDAASSTSRSASRGWRASAATCSTSAARSAPSTG